MKKGEISMQVIGWVVTLAVVIIILIILLVPAFDDIKYLIFGKISDLLRFGP